MHELTITQNMLDLVLEQAKESGAKKVGSINLVIGEMTGVVSDSVRFHFDLIKTGTPAEDASLCFRMVPAEVRCRACGTLFELKPEIVTCPKCKTGDVEVVSGNELFVESIEVD